MPNLKRDHDPRPPKAQPDPVFRNRIRELRMERELTLEGLADLVHTSFQQISRLERSNRKLTQDWMERLAAAFGVRPSEIMEDRRLTDSACPEGQDKCANTDEEFAWLTLFRELTPSERKLAIKLLGHGLGKPERT